MTTFAELLRGPDIDMAAVADHLDQLDHEARVSEVRAVSGGLQAPLYAAAHDSPPLDASFYVPTDAPDRQFVRHYGKNSLPVFTIFEKRFARPKPGSNIMWGFNFSPMMPLVGPGHFLLRRGPSLNEMHVDYYAIPDERLDGAPPLAANNKGISTLVYGNMTDVLRRVSQHVSIGRAFKKGKPTPNYFLLCREA